LVGKAADSYIKKEIENDQHNNINKEQKFSPMIHQGYSFSDQHVADSSDSSDSDDDYQQRVGSSYSYRSHRKPKPPKKKIKKSSKIYLTDECPICYDELNEKRIAGKCGHVYCSECSKKIKLACPICKQTWDKNSITTIILSSKTVAKQAVLASNLVKEKETHNIDEPVVIENLISLGVQKITKIKQNNLEILSVLAKPLFFIDLALSIKHGWNLNRCVGSTDYEWSYCLSIQGITFLNIDLNKLMTEMVSFEWDELIEVINEIYPVSCDVYCTWKPGVFCLAIYGCHIKWPSLEGYDFIKRLQDHPTYSPVFLGLSNKVVIAKKHEHDISFKRIRLKYHTTYEVSTYTTKSSASVKILRKFLDHDPNTYNYTNEVKRLIPPEYEEYTELKGSSFGRENFISGLSGNIPEKHRDSELSWFMKKSSQAYLKYFTLTTEFIKKLAVRFGYRISNNRAYLSINQDYKIINDPMMVAVAFTKLLMVDIDYYPGRIANQEEGMKNLTNYCKQHPELLFRIYSTGSGLHYFLLSHEGNMNTDQHPLMMYHLGCDIPYLVFAHATKEFNVRLSLKIKDYKNKKTHPYKCLGNLGSGKPLSKLVNLCDKHIELSKKYANHLVDSGLIKDQMPSTSLPTVTTTTAP